MRGRGRGGGGCDGCREGRATDVGLRMTADDQRTAPLLMLLLLARTRGNRYSRRPLEPLHMQRRVKCWSPLFFEGKQADSAKSVSTAGECAAERFRLFRNTQQAARLSTTSPPETEASLHHNSGTFYSIVKVTKALPRASTTIASACALSKEAPRRRKEFPSGSVLPLDPRSSAYDKEPRRSVARAAEHLANHGVPR